MKKIERLQYWQHQLKEATTTKDWKKVYYVIGNIQFILNQGGTF